MLGIDPPDWVQGRSFLPLVRGEAEEVNEAVFATLNYHAAYEPTRAVRTKRWKYIRRYSDYRGPVLPNIGPCLSRDVWLEHGLRERRYDTEELYDLVFDPQEACNLAARADHTPTLEALRQRLDAWMEKTNDPLLQGWVPPRAGVRTVDVHGFDNNISCTWVHE